MNIRILLKAVMLISALAIIVSIMYFNPLNQGRYLTITILSPGDEEVEAVPEEYIHIVVNLPPGIYSFIDYPLVAIERVICDGCRYNESSIELSSFEVVAISIRIDGENIGEVTHLVREIPFAVEGLIILMAIIFSSSTGYYIYVTRREGRPQ